MQTINMSFEEFDSIEKVGSVMYTKRRVLYKISYEGMIKMYKSIGGVSILEKKSIISNVEYLDSYRDILPSEFVIPDTLVSIENQPQGILEPFVDGIELGNFLDFNDDKNQNIEILRKIGFILKRLHDIRATGKLSNFFIGDLHEGNILVMPNQEIRFIDLDECKSDRSMEPYSRYFINEDFVCQLSRFGRRKKYHKFQDLNEQTRLIISEETDLFCYCMILINYLFQIDAFDMKLHDLKIILKAMRHVGLNKDLLNAFESLISKNSNINPAEFLDVSEDQIQGMREYSKGKILKYNYGEDLYE